jgi:hypothetical protein
VVVGAAGIAIAAASNNIAKGCYAYGFSDRKTGLQSLCLLTGLALAGLMPLLWVLRQLLCQFNKIMAIAFRVPLRNNSRLYPQSVAQGSRERSHSPAATRRNISPRLH